MMRMRHRLFDTVTGPFALFVHEDGRLGTSWLNAAVQIMLGDSLEDRALMPDLSRRLKAYFNGQRVDFADIALPQAGEFYMRCWNACRTISRGQTRTYAELAAMAGSTAAAARAAGQAMRHNPLPVIIPCHRVIGSGGKLHGFGGSCDASGRELAIKSALLKMEGALIDQTRFSARTARRRHLVAAAG